MKSIADLDIFARVVAAGSMSAAGRELGLSPAVISKRIRRLEERLGTRLLQRTTRQIALTEAGPGLLRAGGRDPRQRRGSRGLGLAQIVGRARRAAGLGADIVRPPARRAASADRSWMRTRDFTVDLVLTDAFVDIVAEGFDVAVRIADLQDSSFVARRLAPNHRILCATPVYLARAWHAGDACGPSPPSPAGPQRRPWRLEGPDGPVSVHVDSPLRTNSSEVVREAVHRRRRDRAALDLGCRAGTPHGPAASGAARLRRLAPGRDSRGLSVPSAPRPEGARLHRLPRRSLRPDATLGRRAGVPDRHAAEAVTGSICDTHACTCRNRVMLMAVGLNKRSFRRK